MIRFLDSVGPAVWRASWQAAVLALLVALVLRCFGERLRPKWRFLLWSVVLVRLLFVATPVSPLSVFNLVQWNPRPSAHATADHVPDVDVSHQPARNSRETTTGSYEAANETSRARTSAQEHSSLPKNVLEPKPSVSSSGGMISTPSSSGLFDAVFVTRLLTFVWLSGCLFLGLKLLATALVLRRRLSACRPVTDPAILELLETTRRRIGLKYTPALLVTPDPLSPCVVGTWNQRIILPESVVTECSSNLHHVLAHELAHLMRGDLWTNWLLLVARILYWFNPAAWWAVSAMQSEREAACDDLAFDALGETDRSRYASTIVELAARLTASGITPGLIGFFSSTDRLKARIERLLRSPSVPAVRTPIAVVLLVGVALFGLTDAMPAARAQPPKEPAAAGKEVLTTGNHTVGGLCMNYDDRSALAGVTVRLYRLAGHTSPPVEIAKMVTGKDGRYEFPGLPAPRPEDEFDPLTYGTFGFAPDRPIGISFRHFFGREQIVQIGMAREKSTLSGKVIDGAGRPIAGATVQHYSIGGRLIPSLPYATTDEKGRFKLDNIGVYKIQGGTVWDTHFTVVHPDYFPAHGKAGVLPADVVVTMSTGCLVTGTVTDKPTDRPAAGAVVTVQRTDVWDKRYVATDADGHFRIAIPEGRYNFLAQSSDRVCVALTDRECLAGEKVELPPLALISGGLISGQVVNTVTGESVTISENGDSIMLGLYGPSQPQGPVISPVRLAAVDKTGRFTLRAAPGDNFPYFVNIRGVRMAWDTTQQSPIVVKDGETTSYNMLITPEISPQEKMKAAQKLVESLSDDKLDRTAQIILEFRKLNKTVDETELWCMLMRELVLIGPDAVPQLCSELDQTIENKMLRRLGFALRAIGDPRAVPALIRAIPKSLLPASSDYGLLVSDKELTAFMQKHDLDAGVGGEYFNVGRPEREIFSAIHALTDQKSGDTDILGLSLSEDPRRQVLQRRIYGRKAKQWQAWWEANWQTFTSDPAYKKVTLVYDEEALLPAHQTLGPKARLVGELGHAVLSPASEQGKYAAHFLDLDSGSQPGWPKQLPRDRPMLDAKQLEEWAVQSGADLMCVTHRSPGGKETFVLRGLGMKLREISARDMRNLDKLISSGKLPEGRPVADLLIHYDVESKQSAPDANGAFLFITRDGNMGVIETTDRVTRAADVTGQPGPSAGVGFHTGVRFDLKAIIP